MEVAVPAWFLTMRQTPLSANVLERPTVSPRTSTGHPTCCESVATHPPSKRSRSNPSTGASTMLDKKLVVAAAAASALTVFGNAAWGQVASTDPTALPPQTSSNPKILYFRDQGNSAETDPAAHLNLITDVQEGAP